MINPNTFDLLRDLIYLESTLGLYRQYEDFFLNVQKVSSWDSCCSPEPPEPNTVIINVFTSTPSSIKVTLIL
jgi:hypothetical protein